MTEDLLHVGRKAVEEMRQDRTIRQRFLGLVFGYPVFVVRPGTAPEDQRPIEPPDHGASTDVETVEWQGQACAWAETILSGAALGPQARRAVARLLCQAEPPGTAAREISRGYNAAKTRLAEGKTL